jgi:hypothetical protein
MQNMAQLNNFSVVALKNAFESYDEDWLIQLKDATNAVIMKTLANNSLIKTADFFKFLKTFVHINSPPNCLALVWRTLSSFF